MSVVYAVSTGSYSDYSVLCVCPTPKIAAAVAAKIKATRETHDDPRVEEFPFFDSPDAVYTFPVFCVETNLEGAEVRRWTYTGKSWDADQISSAVWTSPWGESRSRGVSPRGFEVALEVAHDKIAEHKASAAGL